jgi:hypothetical protein
MLAIRRVTVGPLRMPDERAVLKESSIRYKVDKTYLERLTQTVCWSNIVKTASDPPSDEKIVNYILLIWPIG